MARRRQQSSIGKTIGKGLGGILGDWLKLTFTDRATLGPTSIKVWWVNIAAALILGLWLYFAGFSTNWLIAFGIWFSLTIGRSAMIMPRRRRTVTDLYNATFKSLGHPADRPNQPAPINRLVTVKRWRGANINELRISVGDCPAAASEFTHSTAENSLKNALSQPEDGHVWTFEWPSPTTIHARMVTADDPAALQEKFRNSSTNALASIMRINAREAADYSITFDGWESVQDKTGKAWQFPRDIQLIIGGFDSSQAANRDHLTRSFDNRIKTPGEWVYTWGSQDLHIHRVDADSPEALRKLTERKISDDVQAALRAKPRGMASVTVTEWMDSDDLAVDHPEQIIVDFGTRNLADRRVRSKFEGELDTSLEATFPESTWLYDWHPGATTTLSMQAVPAKSDEARRKRAESRLRNVVESKFGSAKNFVDCDILEWSEMVSERGEAIPEKAQVNFGDYDVSKREIQDAFESHWDSISQDSDWHYAWSPADGLVTITAVPPLPTAMPFPCKGKDFDKIMADAARGRFYLGPQKGGGDRVWDLNEVPHGLVGGKTGSGKSVALSLVLLYGMYHPHMTELIVCDPKRTDFTWTPEFPSVVRFAATDEEIVGAVALAKSEMDKRQSLLNKVGVRNLTQMRDLYKRQPELESKYGPVPKRLIVFFDEIADFLAKSANKDIEELKDEARANLENIARLGRALEVNIIAAAQKPDAKIISTQLRSQLGFRLGVGPLDQYESQQILNSDHGTRFPEEGTPKGRSWAYDSKRGYRQVQVAFLPDDTSPAPWDASLTVTGAKDIARQRLTDLGYSRIEVDNADGGKEPRWVMVEGAEPQAEATVPDTSNGWQLTARDNPIKVTT